MQCIYDKSILCEINPDGPITKDFECLGCHKPDKLKKKTSLKKKKSIPKKKSRKIRRRLRGKKK